METLGNENQQKTSKLYRCNICNYNTSRKCNYDEHLLTAKHQKYSHGNGLDTFGNEIQQKMCNFKYTCQNCDKEFKNRSGLWKHKKICNSYVSTPDVNDLEFDINDKDQLIIMLIKQNAELIKEQGNIRQMIVEQQNVVLEIAKNGTHNTTNSHNKSFNLQFFLNETCKDAMNIMDFVESIKLQLSDLESVGKLGFVEGISNIITNNLNALDITQRPVHCADKKREILYVKDEDKWEKEDEQKNKIRKAIKRVATKNLCLLPKFKEAHPDCSRSSSYYSDQYNKIIIEACGGSGNNDLEKEDKIIRNITKVTTINKN
jgi:hypothetical protein